MWSIGCVFSEVSVWAHSGWRRVHEYRRQRSAEIEAKEGGVGEHIFHFGGNLLDTVDNIHRDMLIKATVQHSITRSVLDRLVLELLQHGTRPHAKFVYELSKRLVQDCEKRHGISVDELGGNANGRLVDSNEARTRTAYRQKVPHEHDRSRAGKEPSLEEPLPPDDDSRPSSSSSTTQSSPHRHHHKSTSQSSTPRNVGTMESPQPGGHVSHVTHKSPPPASTAAAIHESGLPEHVQQLQKDQKDQKDPKPAFLSVDEGHEWKKKKKDGGVAVLPGRENLTSMDRRDHVSHCPFHSKAS